jgi:hypothetical protein
MAEEALDGVEVLVEDCFMPFVSRFWIRAWAGLVVWTNR